MGLATGLWTGSSNLPAMEAEDVDVEDHVTVDNIDHKLVLLKDTKPGLPTSYGHDEGEGENENEDGDVIDDLL